MAQIAAYLEETMFNPLPRQQSSHRKSGVSLNIRIELLPPVDNCITRAIYRAIAYVRSIGAMGVTQLQMFGVAVGRWAQAHIKGLEIIFVVEVVLIMVISSNLLAVALVVMNVQKRQRAKDASYGVVSAAEEAALYFPLLEDSSPNPLISISVV